MERRELGKPRTKLQDYTEDSMAIKAAWSMKARPTRLANEKPQARQQVAMQQIPKTYSPSEAKAAVFLVVTAPLDQSLGHGCGIGELQLATNGHPSSNAANPNSSRLE